MKIKTIYFVCLLAFLFGCSRNSLTNKQLLSRITAAEDRLEILNLLAGSAFSSDVASEVYWAKMFTEDATFDRGAKQDKGKKEVLKIINAPEQKEAIKAGMTHLAMLPHIKLNGDSADALEKAEEHLIKTTL